MSNEDLELISNYFKEKRVIVAFSGGLDSTVLLEIANKTAKQVKAVIVKSIFIHHEEFASAVEFLKNNEIDHLILEMDALSHPLIVKNGSNRCYFCKKEIFENIIEKTKEFNADFIVEGTNATDLSDYRPGIQALKELEIKSPYLELNINKDQIRQIAREMNLSVASKPATTCLATRIPYDEEITEERIVRVEKAENAIKEIIKVEVLRVRDHGDIARIEIAEKDFPLFLSKDNRHRIQEILRVYGYLYVTIDIAGYKQGSMNRAIEIDI